MRIHTDRRYELPGSPEQIWTQISRVDHYQQWWPWLRRLDADGLVDGDTWRCVVQPPLPYIVRFEVRLDEVLAPDRVTATITGDVEGDAVLSLTSRDAGTEARLVSNLGPGSTWLSAIARIATPIARFGHDWVLDAGARQFLRRARADGEASA